MIVARSELTLWTIRSRCAVTFEILLTEIFFAAEDSAFAGIFARSKALAFERRTRTLYGLATRRT
jgi:hypothetical protein